MTDAFLQLRPNSWAPRGGTAAIVIASPTRAISAHSQRAHSKFSASGAERWFKCPGSVALSEGLPDKSSPWAEEGTKAHEVLEAMMRITLAEKEGHRGDADHYRTFQVAPREMKNHARTAAKFIFDLADRNPGSDVLVENRIYLDFIHPEMFGTFDGAVVDYFGTLHVFDYKYGAGHFVSPRENLQMIFYGIGLAHKFSWNFKRVRLWIIQPRVKGYDGPLFWELQSLRLKAWTHYFRAAVKRVETEPESYVEGGHCHWCKAKPVCPVKRKAKLETAKRIFSFPSV